MSNSRKHSTKGCFAGRTRDLDVKKLMLRAAPRRSDDCVKIPNVYQFSRIRRRPKKLKIYWVPSRGKGGHGCFVGPDKKGNIQSDPIGSKDQREIRRIYLQAFFRVKCHRTIPITTDKIRASRRKNLKGLTG